MDEQRQPDKQEKEPQLRRPNEATKDLEPDNDLVERRRTGRKKKPKAPPPASAKKVRRKA